jgi:hypothetical protein
MSHGSCGPNIAMWDGAELHIFSFPYKVNASSDSHFGGGSNLRTSTIAFSHLYVGTHTLYRKTDLCIPRNQTMRPRSQFLHSCIHERFIYYQDRSAYLAPEKNRRTDPKNTVYKSLRDT